MIKVRSPIHYLNRIRHVTQSVLDTAAAAAELKAELPRMRAELRQMQSKIKYQTERGTPAYDADFLTVWHKNVDFMQDSAFLSAYNRGMNSGHSIGRETGSTQDIHIEWRVAHCCWAAWHAKRLDGDFVECGTNTGIISLAICQYLDFNSLDKSFYLFDTFDGIPQEQISSSELAAGRIDQNATYPDCWTLAQKNFAEYPRAHLVKGKVPETLLTVDINKVSYLSIDMNIAFPEREALKFFWDKMVVGGVIVFDDYAWTPYREQKDSHDAFAESKGVKIWTLPTGQGLLFKS